MSKLWFTKRQGTLAYSKSHPSTYTFQGKNFTDWTDAQTQLIENGEIVFKNLGADIFGAVLDMIPRAEHIRKVAIISAGGTSKEMISGVHYDFTAGNVVKTNKIRFRHTFAPADDDYVILDF